MTERDKIELVTCPTCGAIPGDYCLSVKGEQLVSNHFYAQRYCHIARQRLSETRPPLNHTAWPVGRSPA